MKARFRSSAIEPLETRIAPAAVLPFTDVDGDSVIVKTSKGTDADLLAAAQFDVAGTQLQVLDLRELTKFAGTTVTITAKKPDGTVSEVNVGYLNATGNDLGAVKIDGDLGAIDAGNPMKTAAAVASLTVKSLGVLGTTTGAPFDLQSNFDGALGKLIVAGDVKEAYVKVVDTSVTAKGVAVQKANIGSIFIGGSLRGGATTNSGQLYADDLIGKVTIEGDVLGDVGTGSGSIVSSHPFGGKAGIGAVKILGSLKGNSGSDSGRIYSDGPLASLFIGVNLEGGTNFGAGDIFFNDKPASKITIVGDFIGGQFPRAGGGFFNTGEIIASGGFGSFFVGGDMLRSTLTNLGTAKFGSVTVIGSIEGGDASFSGAIQNEGATGKVFVGGNLKGGAGVETGILYFGETTGGKVTSVTVEGSILGGSGDISGNISFFYDVGAVSIGHDVKGADGGLSGTINSYGKIASLKIGGNLEGGTAHVSGMINGPSSTNFSIGKLEIVGSMIGNTGARSGSVWSLGTIGTMIVGGSVSSGTGIGSGGIRANDSIGSLTIQNNVTGNSASSPVFITAGGIDFFTGDYEAKNAIGKVVIKGNVERTKILAGWDAKADQNTPSSHRPVALNGDASIGSVEVRGAWKTSDIVAGAVDGTLDGFGRNDTLITPNVPGKIAKIGSVFLATGEGSATLGEHFGIVAQQLGKLNVNGKVFTPGSGPNSGDLDQVNFNFKYQTVA